ncbi:MAG: metallophosphoesterase [Ferruginibacter sp.]|nr:metallophosphoesterase [Ferruginibacter sp.]
MTRFILTLSFFLSGFTFLFAQDSIQATIVLIGDAGQLTKGHHPVVNAVKQHIPLNEKTTVVYLGDNLYKTGLPDNSLPTYAIAKAPLDSQINIGGKSKAHVYFVPGNHDWANGGTNGYQSILRVQSYIDLLANENVKMFPRDGCPGPVEVKINDDIILVMMDSEWWIHENEKPGIESDCPYKTKSEVLVQLEDIISRNSKKLVLLAFHHPFRSYGPHGGYFTLKQHIFPFTDAIKNFYFPLPVIGSAYPLTRAVFGTSQDLKHPLYQQMIQSVERTVKGHPNVIFMSGHEHTLQMIQDSGYNFIVSGSGSKTSRVSQPKKSLFASGETGFATLQISKNKNVRVTFYIVAGDSIKEAYTNNILNFSKIPEEKPDTLRKIEYAFKDTVVISASDKYKHFSGFKDVFLGSNYRKEWSMAVEFKVFNISKEQGGFKIISLGGGKQTKSLKLKDKNGKEWTLRSVDKDPEKALPENLRGTLAQSIVQDMISASNPYAPLVVPTLAKAVGVPAEQPKFFFVPDDPAFGAYQKIFANTVCTLEDRDPTTDGSETKSTNKILNKLLEDNDHHIDQEAVLKARLLDMLIADFDRHADQWKWGTKDTGKGKLYYPVPRDRDQAFFNSNGLLLKYVGRSELRFLQGFKYHIQNINELNFVARDFDRTFMNTLDRSKWRAITDTFTQRITDQVIIEAAGKYPPEIIPLDSAETVRKLISRRNILVKDAMRYYKFLSKEVTVTGSNEDELFKLQNDSGRLKLSVYKKSEASDSVTVMYRRSFDPKDTKELRLFGLNGADKFEIDPEVSSKIKLRIIGGKGNDTFNLRGNIKTHLYDLSTEKNVFLSLRRTKKELSASPSVLDYSSTGSKYNRLRFPHFNLGFNAEDKLLLGVGFLSTRHGFRKAPYASFQRLSTLFAVSRGAYQLKYQGIFNQAFLKKDLVINAEVVNPVLNNFFGFGNETVYDKSKGIAYYRVRNNYVSGELLLRKRFKGDILQVSAGPAYFHYWNHRDDNKNKILANPAVVGIDSASIYSDKEYVGGRIKFDVNYINNELFPSRGITWYSEFTALQGINRNSRNLTRMTSDMTIYASISDISKVTAVLRAGGGHIFSKNPEFFQALSLGANNYLRGYRKNRFSGSSTAYANAELRMKVFKSKSYVLPGDVGVLGFYDIGKIWIPSERSGKFHSAYGGGLYFVPFNVIMISGTIGFSEEDRLFNFTIGTKFNLSF